MVNYEGEQVVCQIELKDADCPLDSQCFLFDHGVVFLRQLQLLTEEEDWLLLVILGLGQYGPEACGGQRGD